MEMEKHVGCEDIKELTREVDKACGEIKHIKRQIDGNGAKGIAEKVEDHEEYILIQKGGITMIKFLIGFSGIQGITIIGIFLKIFKII